MKYVLSVHVAQHTRQTNSYRQETTRDDGNITTFDPLVETSPKGRPLSMALGEIREDEAEWITEKG